MRMLADGPRMPPMRLERIICHQLASCSIARGAAESAAGFAGKRAHVSKSIHSFTCRAGDLSGSDVDGTAQSRS